MADRLDQIAISLVNAMTDIARGQKVSLPVIQPADAAGITTKMYARLDEAIGKRDAIVGARMACHKGCSACCTTPVLVSEGEGVAVAEWLCDPVNAETRAYFETAYATWRDTIGDLAGMGETSDQEAHRTWMLEVHRRHAMCAFNRDGACTVYPVRPAICRKTHALDTNAHCADENAGTKMYQHPETEQIYDGQRPLRFALHKALRPNHRLDLLCSTVARLLGL
jgi:Fe-S-cluster containining protein